MYVPPQSSYGNTSLNGVVDYYTAFNYKAYDGELYSPCAPVYVGITQTEFVGPVVIYNYTTIFETRNITIMEYFGINFTSPYCFTLFANSTRAITKYTLYSLPPTYAGYLSIPGGLPITPSQLAYNIPADGRLCYTPAPGYCDAVGAQNGALASFIYTASDDKSTSPKSAPVYLYVKCANNPPQVVVPQPFSGKDDTPVLISLLARDLDFQALSFCLMNCPTQGSFYYDVARTQKIVLNQDCTPLSNVVHSSTSIESSVQFYYSAPLGSNGKPFDTCSFKVSDGIVQTNATSFQINIDQSNTPPSCSNIPAVTTNQDIPQIITLSAADAEQPESTLKFFINANCKPGTLFQINGAGAKGAMIDVVGNTPVQVTDPLHRVLFIPISGDSGANYCSFGFTAVDNGGLICSPVKYVPISVIHKDAAPVCFTTSVVGLENQPVVVPLKVIDPDNSQTELSCFLTAVPLRGALYQYSTSTANNQGAPITVASASSPVQVTDSQCRVVFVPVSGTYGQDAKNVDSYYTDFRYIAKDLDNATCTESAVSIGIKQTVFPIPIITTPPVVNVTQGYGYNITLTAENINGYQVCRLLALPNALTGTLRVLGSNQDITASQLPLDVPGCKLQFIPATGYNYIIGTSIGVFPTFTYQVIDNVTQSFPYTVSFNVTPIYTAPVSIQPPIVTAVPNNPTVVTLVGTDVDRENLTFCLQSFPTKGAVYLMNPDGSIGLKITRDMIDSNGCVHLPSTFSGGVTSQSIFYYIPDKTATGSDVFSYIIQDGHGFTVGPTFQSINITSVAIQPPTAGPVTQVVANEDSNPVLVTLTGKNGQGQIDTTLRYYISTLCKQNTLFQYVNGQKGAAINSPNTMITDSQGRLFFVPLTGDFGSNYCNFGFYAQDTNNYTSSEYIIPVNVSRINRAPFAIPVTGYTQQNVAVNLTLTGTDSDGSCVQTYIVGQPSQGTLYQSNGVQIVGASQANPILVTSSNNVVTFVPAKDGYGTTSQQGVQNFYTSLAFIVRECTGDRLSSAVSTVPIGVAQTVVVTPPPVPTLSVIRINENQNITFNLTASYQNQTQLIYAITDLAQRGTLYDAYGQVVTTTIGANGVALPYSVFGGMLTYVPPRNLASSGNPLLPFADFTYTASAGVYTVPQKVVIYINPLAKPPIGTTPSPLTFIEDVRSNPFGLTGYSEITPANKLRFTITRLPVNGLLQQFDGSPVVLGQVIPAQKDSNGNVIAPAPLTYVVLRNHSRGVNFDNFDYQVIDEQGLTSVIKTVQIDIAPVNHPPIAVLLSNTTGTENNSVIVWLGGQDPDLPDDNLTAYITCFPENALLYQVTADGLVDYGHPINRTNAMVFPNRISPNYAGAIAYVPYPGFYGKNLDKVCFNVKDASGATSPAITFPVSILPTTAVPVATGVNYVVQTTPGGNGTMITLGSSGSPGDVINSYISSLPANGKLYNIDGTEITQKDNLVTDDLGRVIFVANNGTSGLGTFTYIVKSGKTQFQSTPSTVQYQVNPVVVGSNTPPSVTVTPVSFLNDGGRRVGYFSVKTTDQQMDPVTLVISKFPDLTSGTLSFNGRTYSIGDAPCRTCNYVLLTPATGSTSPDGKTTTWNFIYSASSLANDSISFLAVDRQIQSAADLAGYQTYSIGLNPGSAPQNGTLISSPFPYYTGGSLADGVRGSDSSSDCGSFWDCYWFWIILAIIGCCLCCCICILCLLIAGVLARSRRNNSGYRRVRRGKNDQPYENLGAYSPPNL